MIEKIAFGQTGHLSTRTLFGAAALGNVTQKEADATLEVLLEYGINHIDTAASYGDSELRIGPWMATHRDTFFLATKTGERTYQAAKAQIHDSLKRLQVDRIDLIQLHNLATEEEWDVAMGANGALKAAIEAKEQGLVRFIGVTGHGTKIPTLHKKSLEHFDFTSVLLPYNYAMMQNPVYAANFEMLYALCQERNVAVQTIKSITRGPWGEKKATHNTWYEPLEDQDEIDKAVSWVLTRPNVFLNTAGDIDLLPKVLSAASRFVAQGQETADSDVADMALEPLFV
ncbi:MAG: aldo/keto reductase [Chloroflexota bacterium]